MRNATRHAAAIACGIAAMCAAAGVAKAQERSYTIVAGAKRIAVAPDGAIFILTQAGAIERLEGGRSARVHTPPRNGSFTDLAVATDGALYASEENNCRVLRIAAPNRSTAVAGGQACWYERAGGTRPSTARMCGAGSLEPAPDGTLLLAEGCNGLVRIRPGATIEPVSGWPADLAAPVAMTAMPDASIVASAAGSGLYRLGPDRPLERLLDWWPSQLARLDAGLLLQRGDDGSLVLLDAAGRLEPVDHGRRPDGRWDGDGEPLPRSLFAGDLARAPDGGVLAVMTDGRLRYLPPPSPGILAVAIRRETLPPATPLRLALSLTRPADVSVEILVDGRRRALRRVRLGAGERVVRVPGASRREVNLVRVVARRPGERAEDQVSLLTGDHLPLGLATWLTYSELTVPTYYDWLVEGRRGCRRFSARRIDCATVEAGSCDGLTSIRLRRDGLLAVAHYDSRDIERCEFRPAVRAGTVIPVPHVTEE